MSRFKLETTKLMQQLRTSRTRGSDMVADVIGYTKSGDSTIGSLDQNFVSHDSSKNFMEKRMYVLFCRIMVRIFINKIREEYIEHEMKKKKSKHSENGQPDNVIRTNSNSLDQKDMIMTRKDSTKESSVPGVNRSGIVEVELPDTYVLKSIEETKKAAQKLREDSKKVSDRSSDDILDVPANFNSDFKKRKSILLHSIF